MAPHPMVPVPQAIMRVLFETAAMMMKRGPQTETISICSSSSAAAAAQDMHIQAVGRISAVDIRASELGYPTYNASIMDGYAINMDEVTRISLTTGQGHHYDDDDDDGDDSWQFHVKDRVYAGPTATTETEALHLPVIIDIDMADYTKTLPKTIYVTTGAVIPPSYNAVIPVEQVDESEMIEYGIISIPYSALVSARGNAWIRPIGCDIKPYTPILKKGDVIEPVHIGLLVQCGVEEVEVRCLPSVGILSTGNELYSHLQARQYPQYGGDGDDDGDDDESTRKVTGTSTGTINGNGNGNGTIPDANGPVLCSLLANYGNCRPRYLGIARDDDEEALTATLRDSIMAHDVIITTGGISMGEMDIIEKVLVENLGCDIHFGRLVSLKCLIA
jgi:molybdopterin biosynthesis enzyme